MILFLHACVVYLDISIIKFSEYFLVAEHP